MNEINRELTKARLKLSTCIICGSKGSEKQLISLRFKNSSFAIFVCKDEMSNCVSAWTSYLIREEGMDRDQAVAVAYEKCERGETPPENTNGDIIVIEEPPPEFD